MSLLVILVSEIGDKTFLIAAVMAMQHSRYACSSKLDTYIRLLVFSAAAGALLVMTILSVAMGQVLPHLISQTFTEIATAALFLVFGIKLGWDTTKMTGYECVEELGEVTAQLMGDDEKKMEEGTESRTSDQYMRLSQVWIQTFVMTFVAEWGDRSQMASMYKIFKILSL